MKKTFLRVLLSSLLLLWSATSHADDLSVFLKSCAYGTAGGAILGLAGMALSEDPGNHVNMVARGASLGLYAGIGFGLYTIYGPQRGQADFAQMKNPVWFSTLSRENKIVGAQINWAHLSF